MKTCGGPFLPGRSRWCLFQPRDLSGSTTQLSSTPPNMEKHIAIIATLCCFAQSAQHFYMSSISQHIRTTTVSSMLHHIVVDVSPHCRLTRLQDIRNVWMSLNVTRKRGAGATSRHQESFKPMTSYDFLCIMDVSILTISRLPNMLQTHGSESGTLSLRSGGF